MKGKCNTGERSDSCRPPPAACARQSKWSILHRSVCRRNCLPLLERIMRFRLAVLFLLAAVTARAAEIRGKNTNAVGGEALGRVEVLVLENKLSAVTSISGEFDIANLPPGSYTLRLNAVGYRMLTIPFTLGAADVKEFSITMVPDNFHHTDKAEVHGDVF